MFITIIQTDPNWSLLSQLPKTYKCKTAICVAQYRHYAQKPSGACLPWWRIFCCISVSASSAVVLSDNEYDVSNMNGANVIENRCYSHTVLVGLAVSDVLVTYWMVLYSCWVLESVPGLRAAIRLTEHHTHSLERGAEPGFTTLHPSFPSAQITRSHRPCVDKSNSTIGLALSLAQPKRQEACKHGLLTGLTQ